MLETMSDCHSSMSHCPRDWSNVRAKILFDNFVVQQLDNISALANLYTHTDLERQTL